MTIPTITTERLILRELRPGDFKVYESFFADPEADVPLER